MKSKSKKFQQSIAYAIIVALLVLALVLYRNRPILSINLVIGVFIGMIMSRTNFSFSGNLRAPILFHDFKHSKLFWNLALITFVGMNGVVLYGLFTGTFDYHKYLLEPTKVSSYFFISAFIFGIGITFTGVGGSGLLRNSINGKPDYMMALIAYFIGSLLGVLIKESLSGVVMESSLYMPEIFGWPLAIIIELTLFALWYKAIHKAEGIYTK